MKPLLTSVLFYLAVVLFSALLAFFAFAFAAISLYAWASSVVGPVAAGFILALVCLAWSLVALPLIGFSPRGRTSSDATSAKDEHPAVMAQLAEWAKDQPITAVIMAFTSGWVYEYLPPEVKEEVGRQLKQQS